MKPSELYYRALNITLVEATLDSDEEISDRRANIASNPRLGNKIGTTALHHLVHTVGAKRILRFSALPYERLGYDVLGYGYNSTVIREPDADDVRKIIRGSDRLNQTEQAMLVRSIEDQIAVSETFHGDVTTPTAVTIEPSPVRGQPVVQLLQPYVSAAAEAPDPNQIIDFAERSLDEMMSTGYLPDVSGRQNLINTKDGIRLIDTVPISIDDPRTFGRCASRLYQMAASGKIDRTA